MSAVAVSSTSPDPGTAGSTFTSSEGRNIVPVLEVKNPRAKSSLTSEIVKLAGAACPARSIGRNVTVGNRYAPTTSRASAF